MHRTHLLVLPVLAVSIFCGCHQASAQCISGAIAITKQDVCECTQRPDYPGGCQNDEFGNKSCNIASYYSCGRNGNQNCMIPYTETVPGSCGNGGYIKTASDVIPLGLSRQDKLTFQELRSAVRKPKSECAGAAEAFKLWLADELRKKEERIPRGAA